MAYMGFMVYRLALCRYMVIGPGLRGYIAASTTEALNFIDGVIAGQCGE